MLLTLAMGSANGLVGTIVTISKEYLPKIPTWKVTSGISLLCLIVGLMYTTPVSDCCKHYTIF